MPVCLLTLTAGKDANSLSPYLLTCREVFGASFENFRTRSLWHLSQVSTLGVSQLQDCPFFNVVVKHHPFFLPAYCPWLPLSRDHTRYGSRQARNKHRFWNIRLSTRKVSEFCYPIKDRRREHSRTREKLSRHHGTSSCLATSRWKLRIQSGPVIGTWSLIVKTVRQDRASLVFFSGQEIFTWPKPCGSMR